MAKHSMNTPNSELAALQDYSQLLIHTSPPMNLIYASSLSNVTKFVRYL